MAQPPAELPTTPVGKRYACHRHLGSGGMGEVYLARDQLTGREVALKLLRADRTERTRALRRFTREVRAMARLEHPTIVAVFDYGIHLDDEGRQRPFFVMEYLEGSSFREVLKNPPDLPEAFALFDRVLSALAFAHARGIIHRDLKPENVFIGSRFEDDPSDIKILDFGIARMLDDDTVAEDELEALELQPTSDAFFIELLDEMSTVELSQMAPIPETPDEESADEVSTEETVAAERAARLTQLNHCVGTPAYLAPEQIHSRRHTVGPSSDLYAFGVMLYEYLCGQRPFYAPNPRELLKKHLAAPIPELVPRDAIEVSPRLRLLVRRLMSKFPHERPALAADVRRELRSILEHRSLPPVSVPPFDAIYQEVQPSTSADNARLTLGLLKFREPPIVGRRDAQKELWKQFTLVHEHRKPRVVIIDGEAGIGKTRLTNWLRESVEESGLARSFIAPYNEEGERGGLRATVERHMGCQGLQGDTLQSRIEFELKCLGLDDPWLASALFSFLRPRDKALGGKRVGMPPAGFTVAEKLLRSFARERPLVFHFEDVHWAPSGEVVELIRSLVDVEPDERFPILIVITVRGEAFLTEPQLKTELDALRQLPVVSSISLEPLSAHDLYGLIRNLLPLEPRLARAVASRAGGHPLFTVQLLHHWAEIGELQPSRDGLHLVRSSEAVPIPTRVNEVVDHRVIAFLDRLERFGVEGDERAVAQHILEWLALVGETASYGLIQELVETEQRSNLLILDTVWEAALNDGICLEEMRLSGQPGDVRFEHRVLRSLLLEWAQSHDNYRPRQKLCAEVKLRRPSRDSTRLHFEVSEHLFEAHEHTDAWRHLVFSARLALSENLYRTSYLRLKRALDLLETPHIQGLSAQEYFDAFRAQVEACIRLGLLDEAESRLRTMHAFAEEQPARLAWIAFFRAFTHDRTGRVEPASSIYQEALDLFTQAGDNDGLARALGGLGSCLNRMGRLRDARTALEQALPVAREGGDDNILAEILVALSKPYRDEGDFDRAEHVLLEALKIHRANNNIQGQGDVHQSLGSLAHTRGLWERSGYHYETARRAHEAVGDRYSMAHDLNGLGEVARAVNELAEAETAYYQALDLMAPFDMLEDEAMFQANLGFIQLHRDRFDQSRQNLTAAAAAFRKLGTRSYEAVVFAMLACIEAETSSFPACQAWLHCIEELNLDVPPVDQDYAQALARASVLAAQASRKNLSRSLLKLAIQGFELLGESQRGELLRAEVAALM